MEEKINITDEEALQKEEPDTENPEENTATENTTEESTEKEQEEEKEPADCGQRANRRTERQISAHRSRI